MTFDRPGAPERELTLSHVTERDIDLLLIEELTASSDLVELVAGRSFPATFRLTEVRRSAWRVFHSVTRGAEVTGETDIELRFDVGGIQALVLIENKIDAQFQAFQPERYTAEAARNVRVGDAMYAATVLVAPAGYLDSTNEAEKFDATLSYEELSTYFAERAERFSSGQPAELELASRLRFRHELIEQAIHKYRRGYAPEVDETVTDFWRRYWQLATTEAPALKLAEPGLKPRLAGFVRFGDSGPQLETGLLATLRHKLPNGRVDLELAGLGAQFDQLAPELEEFLPEGARLRRAGKSVAISIEVPELDTTRPFEPQRADSVVGIRAAERLRDWWTAMAREVADRIAGMAS